MKILMLPTVPCNGNFFLQHLLCGKEMYGDVKPPVNFTCLHQQRDDQILETWKRLPGTVLVHTHFQPDPLLYHHDWYQPRSRVERWLAACDLIISPVRDPLRAMLTAEVCGYYRDLKEGCGWLIDRYLTLKQWKERWGILLVPVDLLQSSTVEERRSWIIKIYDRLGLPLPPFLNTFAADWPVRNHRVNSTTSEYYHSGRPLSKDDVRELYSKGSVEELRKAIPLGYDRLVSKRSELRPLFEELGYRQLAW